MIHEILRPDLQMESSDDSDEYYTTSPNQGPITKLQVVDLVPSKLSCTVYVCNFDFYFLLNFSISLNTGSTLLRGWLKIIKLSLC